jgi:hypothetical protein
MPSSDATPATSKPFSPWKAVAALTPYEIGMASSESTNIDVELEIGILLL